ncbi:MAG TPA: hypothetical protein VI732_07825 [Alphaproteobacteria bacterium]|jgi:hypothetical protein|nr:hypothetical protein [Alphaproteobacteria bacterium]
MIEPQTSPAAHLSAPPVDIAARGARISARGVARGVSQVRFDPEIARGLPQESARPAFHAEVEAGTDAIGDSAPSLPSHDSFAAPAGGTTAAFLAQQIAQEMAVAEFVAPEQAAAAATGSYRAVPVSCVTYDGPQIALDITV